MEGSPATMAERKDIQDIGHLPASAVVIHMERAGHEHKERNQILNGDAEPVPDNELKGNM